MFYRFSSSTAAYDMGKAGSKEKSVEKESKTKALAPDVPKVSMDVEVPFDQYAFPFENAVFGGGRLTSVAYVGAVRFLEDVGIWSRIQRLSGSGSGAIVASLLCIGYNSHQLQNTLQSHLKALNQDHICGNCCLGCNMSSTYGWNPNKKILSWFQAKMKEAIGNQDATFLDVYRKFGRELCIVVTNVSQGRLEYCHPKTTPDLPVSVAVRISMATPGLCSPVKVKLYDKEELFVEGPYLDSYPIHCFDGWWLSMKSDDSFLKKITSVNELSILIDHDNRFATLNAKTLGIFVYDETYLGLLASQFDERKRLSDKGTYPETKLSKNWTQTLNACKPIQEKYNHYRTTADKFHRALVLAFPEATKLFKKTDLQDILKKDTTLSEADLTIVFGNQHSLDDIWKLISNGKTELSHQDFLNYFGQKCLRIQGQHQALRKNNIKSLTDYFEALQMSSLEHRGASIKSQDLDRTIGINIHYLNGFTGGQQLDSSDSTYLMEQGKLAAKVYLQQFISKSVPPIKDAPNRRSFCRDDLPSFIDDEVSEIIDERDYMENLIGRVL